MTLTHHRTGGLTPIALMRYHIGGLTPGGLKHYSGLFFCTKKAPIPGQGRELARGTTLIKKRKRIAAFSFLSQYSLTRITAGISCTLD